MTLEEMQALSTEILTNVSDVGAVSAGLDRIRTAFGEIVTERDNNAARITELETVNNSLRETNMSLFLKTGVNVENEKPKEEEKPAPVSFESLFDEATGKLK